MKKSTLSVIIAVALVVMSVGGYSAFKKYEEHEDRMKEVALLQSLWTMRRAIEFYRQDKSRPPESLQNLISEGYLREIPADPITKSNQTWVVEREKESAIPNSLPGVVGVRSGARGADRGGNPYNQY